MKYSPKQYATALYGALEGKPASEKEAAMKRFLTLLAKNGDWQKMDPILRLFEKKCFREAGRKKVYIETAGRLPEGLKREIENILGGKAEIIHKADPSLLAGMKILIDDEIFIDASAKSKLLKMFSKA